MLTGTLGHYRIVRLLGRGGMGEVYLAEDTSLGRQVALKVLPTELAVSGHRERFEREARAIASLNHPNIVTLHSFEQAGDTPFLTMEYVDGKALGEMIPPGGLPLDRLLKIAIPLADAVGAAHQRGILHRDLKPANVMVTGDGRIKVLDFGLAKLQDDLALGETLPTQELTGEGRIVGTVAYMSPEQAEGRVVDQRSDIFSIGVLLYELATGKRPFTGDTSLSVLSAILKDTPRPVAELRPELPRDFARIVRRALNKDPEERYQSAKDLRNDLNAVAADVASGEIAAAPAVALAPRRRTRAVAVSVTGIAVLAVAAAAWIFVRSMSTAPTAVRPAETWNPTRLTSNGLVGGLVAISPDGRYVAYATMGKGGQGLTLRQVATGSDVEVVPVDAMRFDGITFSPDANFIYYSTYPRGNNYAALYRVPAIGGTPQRILRDLDTPIAFSPDGRRIAFVVDYPSEDRTTVELASADGSERRTLAQRTRSARFLVTPGRLAWSPDGATIAAPVVDGAGQTLALIDAASGAIRLLSDKRWPSVSGAQWLPDNRTLMLASREAGASSTQLWRVDLQTGTGVAVTHDLFNYNDLGVTRDGNAIVAAAGLGESTLWVAAADRLGKPTQITTGAADGEGALGVAWTADSSIVFTSRASGNTDLWRLDPNTGRRQQLTSEPGDDGMPSISPDGRSIAFVSDRQGGSRIWVMHIDGAEPRAISSGPTDVLPVWTPDSASIIFVAANEPRRVNADGSGERSLKAYWPARAGETAKAFMPRAVSAQGLVAGFEEVGAQRGGGWRLAFAPLDASAPPTLLDFTAGTSQNPIAWAPDGKAIDIVLPPDAWNVWRYPIDGRRGFRVTTFVGPAVTRNFTWSANGQLLFSRGENKTDLVVFKRATGS